MKGAKPLPCPFCGGEPEVWFGPNSTMYYVDCTNDACYAKPHVYNAKMAIAVERWNRRRGEKR